jgi:hypothetical protein
MSVESASNRRGQKRRAGRKEGGTHHRRPQELKTEPRKEAVHKRNSAEMDEKEKKWKLVFFFRRTA